MCSHTHTHTHRRAIVVYIYYYTRARTYYILHIYIYIYIRRTSPGGLPPPRRCSRDSIWSPRCSSCTTENNRRRHPLLPTPDRYNSVFFHTCNTHTHTHKYIYKSASDGRTRKNRHRRRRWSRARPSECVYI